MQSTIFDITPRKHLQSQLLQAQKMESMGQLAAGMAHEINTPIQYVSDNVRFLQTAFQGFEALIACVQAHQQSNSEFSAKAEEVNLAFLLQEVPQALQQSLEGLDQVASIVKAIKSFAHPGDEEKVLTDLNGTIQNTITVARNQWKY
ncbi:MAG: histidine kinase, partial [Rhodospirillales bacterium]|nr:histidine kinase [Rhodospirillales bacterium]